VTESSLRQSDGSQDSNMTYMSIWANGKKNTQI